MKKCSPGLNQIYLLVLSLSLTYMASKFAHPMSQADYGSSPLAIGTCLIDRNTNPNVMCIHPNTDGGKHLKIRSDQITLIALMLKNLKDNSIRHFECSVYWDTSSSEVNYEYNM